MGLDMNFYGYEPPNEAIARIEEKLDLSKDDVLIKLSYWRKHANLHGYIVKNFIKNENEIFRNSIVKIPLFEENLRQIIQAIKTGLPYSGGFDSLSNGSEKEISNDLLILDKALEWLLAKEGRKIYYRASW